MKERVQHITNIKESVLFKLDLKAQNFLIQAAENYLEYMQTYDKGLEIIKLQNVSKDIFGLCLQLEYRLKSIESLILRTPLGDFVLEKESEEHISIVAYDEKSKTLSLSMSENLCEELFKQRESLQLISDLKFLVQNVIHFYSQEYSLQLPTIPPSLKPNIDALQELQMPPHSEQLNALKGIFENPLCYIWGAE